MRPFSGTSRPRKPTVIVVGDSAPSVGRAPSDAPVASSHAWAVPTGSPAGRNRSRSTPSGITLARPAKPLVSTMRAASTLQADTPAAVRSARRSNQRNGTG